MTMQTTEDAPAVLSSALLGDFRKVIAEVESLREKGAEIYDKLVQEIVDRHGVHLATGWASDTWQYRHRHGKIWRDDMDEEPAHPVFDDLKALDNIGEEIGCGPGNMMSYSPNREINEPGSDKL